MPDPAGGRLHRGWSWTVRHPRVLPAGYWVAGLLFGFALGNVPSLVTGDWKSGSTVVSLGLSVGATVIAVVVFALTEITRRGQRGMLESRGTAYIIQEFARFWDKDTAARFREGIRRQFARVVQVPGPAELDRAWDWSLDEDAVDWDAKADELVRAFRVLALDEARASAEPTPNSVFLWAYGAIATAFGMRVTAADRELVLDVWQRPSKARSGEVEPQIWAQRPYRFKQVLGGLGTAPEFTERTWSATLEDTRIAPQRGTVSRGAVRPVAVLLLRFSAEEWGPLPPVTEEPEGPLTLRLRTAVHLPVGGPGPGRGPDGKPQVDIYELRCVPPLNTVDQPEFPWDQFPALAAKAAAWIEAKAKELGDHTLLLGTAMPQEVSLGLGIHAGQVSRRSAWPAELWPIVFNPGTRGLVAPNLQLGTVAVDPALGRSADPARVSGEA